VDQRSGNYAQYAVSGAAPRNAPVNLPNTITLMRAVLVPVIFWMMLSGNVVAAFFVFVLAGASDAVDGYLAKRFGWQTELGAYLDPVADKLLITCVFIAMAVRGEIPLWLAIAVVSRDVLIIAAILISWLLDRPVRIKPLLISKINTFAQLVLAATVLADLAFGLGLVTLRQLLVWITGVLTIASFVAYIKAWAQHVGAGSVAAGS
jgi:cardiolipin synthase